MKLNLPYRFCDFCHKAYLPVRKGQRFCRPKCRAAWHRSDFRFLRKMAPENLTPENPDMVLVRREDIHIIMMFESDGSRQKEWQEAFHRLKAALEVKEPR